MYPGAPDSTYYLTVISVGQIIVSMPMEKKIPERIILEAHMLYTVPLLSYPLKKKNLVIHGKHIDNKKNEINVLTGIRLPSLPHLPS